MKARSLLIINSMAVLLVISAEAQSLQTNIHLNAKEMIQKLGCQCVSYKTGFPTVPYNNALEANKYWKWFISNFSDVLYAPNVSMGWDARPHCIQSDQFGLNDYPFTPVLSGITPEAFTGALADANRFLDKYNPRFKIIVLNAWNELREERYLLPGKIWKRLSKK